MRKAFSLLLVLAMLLSLCACRKNDAHDTDSSSNPGQTITDNVKDPTNNTSDDDNSSASTPTKPSDETTDSDKDSQSSIEKPNEPSVNPEMPPESSTKPSVDTKLPSTESDQKPTTKPSDCEHEFTVATCRIPKVCTKCEEIAGHSLPHTYQNGTCTVCGLAEMLEDFKKGDWVARVVTPGTNEQGEILSEYILKENERTYENIVCYLNASSCVMNIGKVIYNEKTYYADFYPSTHMSCTWKENGDVITITVTKGQYDDVVVEFVLSKTSETKLTVISSTNTSIVPVEIVFVKQ